MMYDDLREEAVKELERKNKKWKEIQTVGVTFATVSIILFIISTRLYPAPAFWVRLPILILALVFGIVYTSEYGLPFFGSEVELTDEEIELEMVKIYRKSNLRKLSNDANEDNLELKELEELKDKYERGEDFV